MKYIKKFNEEYGVSIEVWCEQLDITNYTINEDETVDCNSGVDISNYGLSEFPIQFGVVSRYFQCNDNKLTTLKGSPKEVKGDFYCVSNYLTSLEGCTKKIGMTFNCRINKLITLDGCANIINGEFYCSDNKLTTLEGGPEKVGRNYFCNRNNLISLKGGPKELGGRIDCVFNPIENIYYLFSTYKRYQDSLDYNYLRGDCIIKLRFQEACEEAGIKVPESIPGYKYI